MHSPPTPSFEFLPVVFGRMLYVANTSGRKGMLSASRRHRGADVWKMVPWELAVLEVR